MKIVFMGTPEIAVPVLETLIKSEHEVAAVVTRVDTAKGRHGALTPSPVKKKALEYAITVLQPQKASDPVFLSQLAAFNADVFVVMAYGKILKPELLAIPPLGCVNIHTSLLPMYRGASPISAVILAGEKETGVTTMLMDEGLDTGDILLTEKVAIESKETTLSLEEKLSQAACGLILRTLAGLNDGSVKPVKQIGDTCYAGMIKKEDGLINWNEPAELIERKIRAYYPWPGAYTTYKGSRIKIFDVDVLPTGGECTPCSIGTDVAFGAGNSTSCSIHADVVSASVEKGVSDAVSAAKESAPCGTIADLPDNKAITVICGEGNLMINELQAEGKKRMKTADFLRGVKISVGEKLGE